jgi:hypothetical protein
MKNQREAVVTSKKLEVVDMIRENLGLLYGCWLCLLDEIVGLEDSEVKIYLRKELGKGIEVRDVGGLCEMRYRVYRLMKMLKSRGLGGGLLKFLKGIEEALNCLLGYLEGGRS